MIELTPGQNGDTTVIPHQFSPTSLGTVTYSQQQPNGFTLGANPLGISNNGDLFVYNAGRIDIFYQFQNPASGEQPSAAHLSMGDGSLVGITAYGGLTKNCNGFDSCGVLTADGYAIPATRTTAVPPMAIAPTMANTSRQPPAGTPIRASARVA